MPDRGFRYIIWNVGEKKVIFIKSDKILYLPSVFGDKITSSLLIQKMLQKQILRDRDRDSDCDRDSDSDP